MGPHLLCRVVIANLRVLALIGILINLLATPGHSQAVVISEYYNDNPPQEWTELLVIQDDLDLRGWIVTDNNASQTARQGGSVFATFHIGSMSVLVRSSAFGIGTTFLLRRKILIPRWQMGVLC